MPLVTGSHPLLHLQRLVMRDPVTVLYRPEASLHRISFKIPGHEPSDMPPDWQRPFTSLATSVGMQLRSSYLRSGCVHLLLELGHLHGLSDDDALAFITGLPPEQWLVLLGQEAMMQNRDIVLQVGETGGTVGLMADMDGPELVEATRCPVYAHPGLIPVHPFPL